MIGPLAVPIAGIAAGVIITIGLPLVRAYSRRMEQVPRGDSPEMQAQLARMEQAIDAIAVEVERISEAQRFTTKLLADRVQDAPAIGAEVRR